MYLTIRIPGPPFPFAAAPPPPVLVSPCLFTRPVHGSPGLSYPPPPIPPVPGAPGPPGYLPPCPPPPNHAPGWARGELSP